MRKISSDHFQIVILIFNSYAEGFCQLHLSAMNECSSKLVEEKTCFGKIEKFVVKVLSFDTICLWNQDSGKWHGK